MFSTEEIKDFIKGMSTVFELTHDIFALIGLILVSGGLYVFFSTKPNIRLGMIGMDPNRHGAGLGVSMFVAGSCLMVLVSFIKIFTIQFAAEPNPLHTLSHSEEVIAGAGDDLTVLFIRACGVYFTWLGVFFFARGLISVAGAGSVQISGAKMFGLSSLGGLGLILMGNYMSRFSFA